MSGAEAKEQSKVLKWLMTKPEVWVVKYPGGIFGKKGTPDLLLCVNGRFVAIEMKKPEGGVRAKIQEATRQKILKSGGICEFCDSFIDAKSLIEEVLSGQRV